MLAIETTSVATDVETVEAPLQEVEDELVELASHLYAGTCRWLELVAEFDRREGWGRWIGCLSCAHWISWRCGVAPRAAREHVRVARALEGLPAIRGAFSRGELSYSKVRALTRVGTPEREEELLELAGYLTAAQLERALRAYQRVTTEEAREVHERENLSYYWDEDGSLVVRGRLAPEDGALFVRALETGRDAVRERRREETDGGSAEPRWPGAAAGSCVGGTDGSAEPPQRPRVSNVEAFVALAETALVGGRGEARSGGDRRQLVVHVDADVLSNDAAGRSELADGPAIAPETARRLACDAAIVPITESDGIPLSVGRKARTIPAAMRRALEARDGHCRFPGCENHRFVDAHHVRHWAHGGETTLDNLVLLCRTHHRLVHEGGYTVERSSGGETRFRNQYGLPVPSVPRPPPGSLDGLLERHRHAELVIDSETCRNGTGERMELDLTVHGLLSLVGRRRVFCGSSAR